MMNRLLIGAVGLFLILGIVGLATPVNGWLTRYAYDLITVAEDIGLIVMLINGTFISTRLYKIALFFFGLMIVGILFRILHLPGGDELSTYPFAVIFCLYAAHFWNKSPKRRVDILKLIMLTGFLLLPPVVILHMISEETRETLQLISNVLFWITFLDFLYTSHREDVPQKQE